MKESLSGTAEMEDIEEGTFVAFCEFGYRGRYRTPSRTYEEEEDSESRLKQEGSNQIARISDSQSAQIDSEESESDREEQPSPTYDYERPFLCFDDPACSPSREHFKPKMASTYVISPPKRRWHQFETLKFPGGEAVKAQNPDLLAHAKIYIFATRYLVDSLREQSLKSLHRDLCDFNLSTQNMSHFLDLLQYTFEHTGRQEPGGSSSLRRIVIDYTSCKAKVLIQSSRFRQILDMFGEIGSDLVAKIVQ
jgi:hypothetical protein